MTEQARNKKIIVFNGPAGVGKDHIANHVQKQLIKHAPHLKPNLEKMMLQCKIATHALFGLFHTPEHIDKERLKDTTCSDLIYGGTYRDNYVRFQAMIRREFGDDVFGHLMEHNLRRKPNAMVHIFSDSGVALEWYPVIDYVGGNSVLLVVLEGRQEAQFNDDVRGYMHHDLHARYPDLGVVRMPHAIAGTSDLTLKRTLVWGAVKKFLSLDVEDD